MLRVICESSLICIPSGLIDTCAPDLESLYSVYHVLSLLFGLHCKSLVLRTKGWGSLAAGANAVIVAFFVDGVAVDIVPSTGSPLG